MSYVADCFLFMRFQGATQAPAYLALAKWMYSTNWEWIRSWDSLLTAFWGSLAKRMYQNTATGPCSWSTMDTRPSAQTWINWDTSALRKKTASSFTHVACSSIPPTSAATAYHAQRAYYQVQVWLFQMAIWIRPIGAGKMLMKSFPLSTPICHLHQLTG